MFEKTETRARAEAKEPPLDPIEIMQVAIECLSPDAAGLESVLDRCGRDR